METNNGGCCIARCATRRAHSMSMVDKIMLRFRPIAPKPLPAAALSDASSSENAADAFSRSAKRKDNKRCSTTTRGIRRRRNAPPPPQPPPPAVTLPLLPETPDPEKTIPEKKNKNVPPVWLSFENRGAAVPEKVDRCWYSQAPASAGSVVTVECVTDTWMGLGSGDGDGDGERKMKLGEDTCPGFISDGYGRVTWTNEAYRETVGGGGVWLANAMKVAVPYPYRGFTCRVRVQYACGKERTVPCDVWRMDSGGFAWRLDLQAALSLSLAL